MRAVSEMKVGLATKSHSTMRSRSNQAIGMCTTKGEGVGLSRPVRLHAAQELR